MGGAVAVTVRDWDNRIHKMIRHTNNFTYWFHSPKFFDGDKEHLQAYLDDAPNSMFYDEDALMVPDGDGLIVVDCINKKIFSAQGYTAIGEIFGPRISLYQKNLYTGQESSVPIIFQNVFDPMCREDNIAVEYQKRGWLYYRDKFDQEFKKVPDDLDIIYRCSDKYEKDTGKSSLIIFEFRPPDWEIINNYDDTDGFRNLRKQLEPYFTFTEEETKQWDEYLKELV